MLRLLTWYCLRHFGLWLANNLGIPRKVAKQYIETYFERYPGIKKLHGARGA